MANQSAVIDMGDDGDDQYEDFYQPPPGAPSAGPMRSNDGESDGLFSVQGAQKNVQEQMASFLWEAGKNRAGKAWSIYGNIDLLRPYFDVEPKEVLVRILASLVPRPPTATPIKVHTELYGPCMLVLTLIALLLYEMKQAGHTVQEGTLMGSAFATCFGYWLGAGIFIWLTGYVCNTHLSMLQTLSVLGYSLAAQCAVVLTSCLVHTGHDEMFFYMLFAVLGGLSTLRMFSIAISRTHGPTQKLVICSVIGALSFGFMLYLHFAYHAVVEEMSHIIQSLKQEGSLLKTENNRTKISS